MKTFESMHPRVVATTNASRVELPRPLVVASSSSSPVPRASSASPRRRDSNGRLLHRPRRGRVLRVHLVDDARAPTTRVVRAVGNARAHACATTDANERRRRRPRARARVPTRVEDAHAPCTYTTPLARQQTNGRVARDAREAMTRESRGITRGGWSYLH